jgi:hypothetical protein
MKVKVGKVVLRYGVSVKSGFFITYCSFGVLPRDTATVLLEGKNIALNGVFPSR